MRPGGSATRLLAAGRCGTGRGMSRAERPAPGDREHSVRTAPGRVRCRRHEMAHTPLTATPIPALPPAGARKRVRLRPDLGRATAPAALVPVGVVRAAPRAGHLTGVTVRPGWLWRRSRAAAGLRATRAWGAAAVAVAGGRWLVPVPRPRAGWESGGSPGRCQ